MPYTVEEVMQIISIRANVEGIEIQSDALQALGEIGIKSCLRYAAQMLTSSSILAETTGRTKVNPCRNNTSILFYYTNLLLGQTLDKYYLTHNFINYIFRYYIFTGCEPKSHVNDSIILV